jgi:beta-aspartyl-peptidase (threonine type)
VTLDKKGNLAAATSTGGMSGKKWGRVGDVPVIGAGTYANNSSAAISGTGHGEYWIRRVVAFDICALMEYRGLTLQQASEEVIFGKIDPMGGSGGGIIAVDKNGNISMVFNTGLMYRGWAKSTGEFGVGVLKGEEKVHYKTDEQ